MDDGADGDGVGDAQQTAGADPDAPDYSSAAASDSDANVALSDGTCVFLTLLASLLLLSLVVAVRRVARRCSAARAFDAASESSRRITDSFEVDCDEASIGGWLGGGGGGGEDGEDACSSVRSGRRKRRRKRKQKTPTASGAAKTDDADADANAGFYAPPPEDDNDSSVMRADRYRGDCRPRGVGGGSSDATATSEALEPPGSSASSSASAPASMGEGAIV